MAEMMVNLRVLRELEPVLEEQRAAGVEIRRARESESDLIVEWVSESINPNWRAVCQVALEQMPPACFVAHENDAELSPENMLGFACYNVVTGGVFGPSGVREDQADTDVGTALLLACLHEMAAEKSTEAVIGWAGTAVGRSN